MTKQELLSKLSEEELLLLGDIMSCDITGELNKRKKTPMEVKVGDCFIYRNGYDYINLTKVTSYTPEDHHSDEQYFDCKEISIDSYDIDMYEMDHYIDDFDEHDRIDAEIFDRIEALVNNRDNTVDKICEEFNKQIRELCSTLLNTQNKN